MNIASEREYFARRIAKELEASRASSGQFADTHHVIAEEYQRRLALLDLKATSGGGADQRRGRKSRNAAPPKDAGVAC